MQTKIKAVCMRGGTSKGLFFHDHDLPKDPAVRDRVILSAFGSPDPNRRQIDGMGGGVSTTSKMAIISPSPSPDYDVVYNFGQVSIDRPLVDYKSNCGNISSAVGPFAVDEGLVPVTEPVTRVRIHQKNTDKLIIAEVPVKNGRFDEDGDYEIAGIPNTSAKITLRFADPGGAVTGRLLPTGNVTDSLSIPGREPVKVTIIDAANPVVFVEAESIGLAGIEIDEIDNSNDIKNLLESIRAHAAVRVGITATAEEATLKSQAVPKIAMVTSAKDYTTTGERQLTAADVDLVARIMSMGTLHRSFAVSGAVATAGAAQIPGTVVTDLLPETTAHKELLLIGHPGGIIDVGAVMGRDGDDWVYKEAVVGRTARRLMEGYVLVPDDRFE